MLHLFLDNNRPELVARCLAKAAKRAGPGAEVPINEHGIPLFLGQLISVLREEQSPQSLARVKQAKHGTPSLQLVPSTIPGTASRHGEELRRQGMTIDQVVHGYGDLCQALTELALERDEPISVDEFHTFNRCLDDAIADAVTAYARNPADPGLKGEMPAALVRMQALAELAVLSFAAIRGGNVGLKGSTATTHEQVLGELSALADFAAGREAREA